MLDGFRVTTSHGNQRQYRSKQTSDQPITQMPIYGERLYTGHAGVGGVSLCTKNTELVWRRNLVSQLYFKYGFCFDLPHEITGHLCMASVCGTTFIWGWS